MEIKVYNSCGLKSRSNAVFKVGFMSLEKYNCCGLTGNREPHPLCVSEIS